jgi:hypothetical protein
MGLPQELRMSGSIRVVNHFLPHGYLVGGAITILKKYESQLEG